MFAAIGALYCHAGSSHAKPAAKRSRRAITMRMQKIRHAGYIIIARCKRLCMQGKGESVFPCFGALPKSGSARVGRGMEAKELRNAIVGSVRSCVGKEKRCGVLFSGGIDSSLLAAIASKRTKTTCYAAGVEGSQDLEWAEKVAKEAGFVLKEKIIDNVEGYAKKVLASIPEKDWLNLSVGIPIYAACGLAAQNGEKMLLAGGGAEELFCGYHRHREALARGGYAAVVREYEGWEKRVEKDLKRDNAIAKACGVEIRTPYLDRRVVDIAMKMPLEEKITKTENKIALRNVAREFLPAWACSRPKKAAQYGSGVDRALRLLAEGRGFGKMQGYVAFLANGKA